MKDGNHGFTEENEGDEDEKIEGTFVDFCFNFYPCVSVFIRG